MRNGLLVVCFLLWAELTAAQTYYSYQTGNWSASSTWTTDPSGTVQAPVGGPAVINGANYVVLNGRTVSLSANSGLTGSLTINEGGIFDMAGFSFTGTLSALSGQGSLRLSTGNFPAATTNTFVQAGGGQTTYYSNANYTISTTQATYNDLRFIGTGIKTLARNITVNGYMNVVAGTFQIGNNGTGRTLTVNGNVTVSSGASLTVGTSNATHTVDLYGNLTNEGTVRFTNLAGPDYTNAATNGTATVTFRGSTDNVLWCRGTTDFYRLLINKGVDQTYGLRVLSTNTANFRILGQNNQGGDVFEPPTDLKAFVIFNGYVRFGNNISIPSLTEGGQDFNLRSTAKLWVDSATVSTTTAANGTGYQAGTIYGHLLVSAGSFSTGNAAGLVMGAIGSPIVELQGGTMDISQIWSVSGNTMSLVISGGNFNIRQQGEAQGGAMLNIIGANALFNMSGGNLNFQNAVVNAGLGIDFRGTGTVTGGNVNVTLSGAQTFGVNSTAPFYNFTVTSNAGTLTLQGLNTSRTYFEVLNDFTLNTNVALDLNTNNTSVYVGGDMTVANGATLNMDVTSELRFNETAGTTQILTLSNASPSITNIRSMPSESGTLQVAGNNPSITQSLRILSGTFDDNGRTVSVQNTLENSGTHIGAGRIESTGGNALTISGDGTGVFQNLYLNHTNGAAGAVNTTFTASMTINGAFTLNQTRRVDIGANRLSLGQNATLVSGAGGFSANRMIIMNGAFGGGAVSRTFSALGTSFTFPIGNAANYRPVTTTITSATLWGNVVVRPVNNEHPNVTAAGRSLVTYWRVTQENFLTPGGITHTFTYPNGDAIVGGNVTEAGYRPAYFNRSTLGWVKVGGVLDVDEVANLITFTGIGQIEGEFTAGDDNPTDPFGTVNIYYSRASTNWETNSTWSLNQPNGSGVQNVPPAGAVVVLTSNFTVTVTANGKDVSSLTFRPNATLDIVNTNGHNFDIVSNDDQTGRFRSRRDGYFPTGDWSQFIGSNGAVVEYYTNGPNIALPNTPVTYYNLDINPAVGDVITLPGANLTIYNTLATGGAGTVQSAGSVRTLAVNGNIEVESGTFTLANNAYAITVGGNVVVSNGAMFRGIAGGGAAVHTMTIAGNLTNNGSVIFDANGDVALTFTGAGTTGWTGSATSTNTLYTITINKGIDATSLFNFNVANGGTVTTTGNVLTLINGTFRHQGSQALTLSTTAGFTIPATAGLTNAGTGTLNIGAANNDAGDLFLAGTLTVENGTVNVGNTTDNNNNNDIEYSQAGFPAINVSGGTLFVRGQIRRNLINVSGSLQFALSGTGLVRIHGRNANTTRGNFEILNGGSTFSMSGTSTLTVHRGTGGAGIADIVLTPETASITGGTVIVGPDIAAINPGNQTIDLNSDFALNNLSVVRQGANTTIARLEVNDLTAAGTVTINTGTTLDAVTNSRNVSIGGDFVVSGTYSPGTNVTTFDGSGAQAFTLNAAVTIANMVVDKSAGTLTLGGTQNLIVSTSFELSQGALADGGRTITIQGNSITNNGTHSGAGSLTLTTGAFQTVSGSGTFGNLTLNNASGVTLAGSFTINGALTLTNGVVVLGSNLLTLGSSASISGAAAARYIRTNGQLSDQGLRKNYNSGAVNFTFPIGSPSKYTPVSINISANSVPGTITVKPVNQAHPMTTSAANTQLNYYWVVSSTGFSGVTATHIYNYLNADVNGTEASYVAARLNNLAWTSGATINGTVTPASDLFTLANVNFISGEYTAGLVAEFSTILTYYSRNNRGSDDWSTASNWSTVGHADNTSPATPPNGNPVRIASGHTIQMSSSTQTAGALVLDGTLNLGTTIGHNFGTVTGTGVLQIGTVNVVFPGGNFDVFNGPSGGTVEFTAVADQVLPPIPTYKNLRFLGSSTKSLPAQDIVVYGDIEFGGGNFNSNSRSVSVQGNWINNTADAAYIPGNSTVSFTGNAAQSIEGAFSTNFYGMIVDNSDPVGVTLSADISISSSLTFIQGFLNSGSNLITMGTNSFISGEIPTSYARGSVQFAQTVGAAQSSNLGNIGLVLGTGADNLGTVTVRRVAGTAAALPTGYPQTISRRWVISSTNPPASGRNLTFSWFPSEDNANDITSMQVYRRASEGSGILTVVGPSFNVPNTTPRSVTVTTTSFSEWTVWDSDPLPVELSAFSLHANDDAVEITWTTVTERDNYGFFVQRRAKPDPKNDRLKQFSETLSLEWINLGFVEGNGTSYTEHTYGFTDRNLTVSAIYEYRLLQVDYNGDTAEHGPLTYEMKAPDDTRLLAPFPNPFNPATTIPVQLAADGPLKIEIFDMLGRRVYTLSNQILPAGTHRFTFNASRFASGIYIVRLQANGQNLLRKITLVK